MAVKNDCNEIIELLLNNPDIEVNYEDIFEASYEISYSESKYHSTDNDFVYSDDGSEENNVLLSALKNGNKNIVRLLLSRDDLDIDIYRKYKIINNIEDVFRFIRSLEDNYNIENFTKEDTVEIEYEEISVFDYAIHKDQTEILMLFLKFNKINFSQVGGELFDYAIIHNNDEMIDILISNPGFNDISNFNKCFIDSIKHGNMKIFNFLLGKSEIDVNLIEKSKTPLISAIVNNNMEAFHILLDRPEINVNIICKNSTPLISAIKVGNTDALNTLLARPDININIISGNKTALKTAVLKENFEIVELLLNHPEINVNDNSGDETALKIAVEKKILK